MLKQTVELGTIKSGDLRKILPNLKPSQITYQLGKLVERGLLQPIKEGSRIYIANFSNSYLIRGGY